MPDRIPAKQVMSVLPPVFPLKNDVPNGDMMVTVHTCVTLLYVSDMTLLGLSSRFHVQVPGSYAWNK